MNEVCDSCNVGTTVRLQICPPGVDCLGNKILDMYGYQGRYKALGDCGWTDTPIILHPTKVFDITVPSDAEVEFQWRAIRHAVKWQDTAGGPIHPVYSTIPGPWSESTVFSVAVARPIQGQPAKVILTPGCVH